MSDSPPPVPLASPVAKSPHILAIQKEAPPSLAASVRSGRELVQDRDEVRTTFVPPTVYTFCTSSEHTVTACLANSTVDSPVRMIAEHLFGLGYGSFQLFTGEDSKSPTPSGVSKNPPVIKGVKAWLQKLSLRQRKAGKAAASATKAQQERSQEVAAADETSSQTMSDGSDADPITDNHWKDIRPLSKAELAEVRRCGEWRGANPSDLFLNIYGQALLTLEKNVLNGLVSPPLMGTTGVAPMTIISHSFDIVQHYAELILKAEREIFFTTNVWEASEASRYVTDAIRELSKRVIERGGDKIVMKLMYDRGGVPPQAGAHQIVKPEVYTAAGVELPAPDEIPGVLLEVQNYHVYPVGSFHQKSLVIDRKVAVLSSNNVQRKGDVGFMVQFEGPIVQSIYDTALLSWWTTLNPRPPLLYHSPTYPAKLDRTAFEFGDQHPLINGKGNLQAMAERTVQRLTRGTVTPSGPPPGAERSRSPLRPSSMASRGTGVGGCADDNALSSSPRGAASLLNSKVNATASSPDAANGTASSSLPTPVENQPVAEEPTPAVAHISTEFTPVLAHKPHDPFPIAMMNRTPRGRRGQGDAFVPQNQAWLAAFKFAEESVFIQTPTFSARPIVAAALDAVRRGVLVEIYADLGFNEEGELSQDGMTNQAVAAYMYKHLEEDQRDRLRICWYVAKGETSPQTSHTCHIKIMIVDGKIAVQGNGRQDMPSWYHAQEINVLIDSPDICAEWRRVLETNQDTGIRGRVGHDGVWRDAHGHSLAIPDPTPTLSLGVALRRLNTSTSVATSGGGSSGQGQGSTPLASPPLPTS